jgi:hypothetical protein
MGRIGLLVATCAVVLSACGRGGRYDANAVVRPAEMVVDREVVEPGDTVGLEFPQGRVRGLMFALEQEVAETWQYRYSLISTGLSGEATWHSADDSPAYDANVEMFAGSERVRIPDDAEPGTWRICTTDARENVCVQFDIVDS